MRVAVLGMGAMGSRVARRLIEAGFDVTVWNRTPERCRPLETLGARGIKCPKEAPTYATHIISFVRDDAASRAVWLDSETGVLAGDVGDQTLCIEASTVSIACLKALEKQCIPQNIGILAAPVVGSRPQAEVGALVVLAGGRTEALMRAQPVLNAFSAKVVDLPTVEDAAAAKLAVNTLFAVQVAAVAELNAVLASSARDQILDGISTLPVFSPAASAALAAIRAGTHAPMFPIELVAKDMGLAVEASHGPEGLVAATKSLFEKASRAGLGEKNITGIAECFG